jgi:hypothetical protein
MNKPAPTPLTLKLQRHMKSGNIIRIWFMGEAQRTKKENVWCVGWGTRGCFTRSSHSPFEYFTSWLPSCILRAHPIIPDPFQCLEVTTAIQKKLCKHIFILWQLRCVLDPVSQQLSHIVLVVLYGSRCFTGGFWGRQKLFCVDKS